MSGALLLSNWRIGQTAARLLALHVGGVTGNTHSHAPNEGRDDRFVSGCRAGLLLLRHGADLIAGGVSVNQCYLFGVSALANSDRQLELFANSLYRHVSAIKQVKGNQWKRH